jgi:hypothetical protein
MKRRLGLAAAALVGAGSLVIPAGTAHAQTARCDKIVQTFDSTAAAVQSDPHLTRRQKQKILFVLFVEEQAALAAAHCR